MSAERADVPDGRKQDLAVEKVAQDLYERDPYRELTAIMWTIGCARVIRAVTGREPLAGEVSLVASCVSRSRSPEDIVDTLMPAWFRSWPPHTGAELWAIVRPIFDYDRWRSFLLSPAACNAAAADVVHVAGRVWVEKA